MANRLIPQDIMFATTGLDPSTDLSVDGSVTPIDFIVSPPGGQVWMIDFLSIVLVDDFSNWGHSLFGSLGRLNKGLQILFDSGNPSSEIVEATIQDNSDLDHFFGGSEQAVAVGGGGGIYNTDRFFSGRMSFNLSTFSEKLNREPDRNIFLEGDNNERAIIRVRDDLTNINLNGGKITMSGRFYARFK